MTNKHEQALEKIKENNCIGCELFISDICIADKSYEPLGKKHKEICWEHCTNKLFEVQRIATQALAPQECDVKEAQLFKQDMFNFFVQEHDLHLLDGQMNDIINFVHKYYPDEQLHSQEKTFTVQEVREIAKEAYNKGINQVKDYLVEFEKAVG